LQDLASHILKCMAKGAPKADKASKPFATKLMYTNLLRDVIETMGNHGLYLKTEITADSRSPDFFTVNKHIVGNDGHVEADFNLILKKLQDDKTLAFQSHIKKNHMTRETFKSSDMSIRPCVFHMLLLMWKHHITYTRLIPANNATSEATSCFAKGLYTSSSVTNTAATLDNLHVRKLGDPFGTKVDNLSAFVINDTDNDMNSIQQIAALLFKVVNAVTGQSPAYVALRTRGNLWFKRNKKVTIFPILRDRKLSTTVDNEEVEEEEEEDETRQGVTPPTGGSAGKRKSSRKKKKTNEEMEEERKEIALMEYACILDDFRGELVGLGSPVLTASFQSVLAQFTSVVRAFTNQAPISFAQYYQQDESSRRNLDKDCIDVDEDDDAEEGSSTLSRETLLETLRDFATKYTRAITDFCQPDEERVWQAMRVNRPLNKNPTSRPYSDNWIFVKPRDIRSVRITYKGGKSKMIWVNELVEIIKDSENRGWVTSLYRKATKDAPTVNEDAAPDFLAFCKKEHLDSISTLSMTFNTALFGEESEKY